MTITKKDFKLIIPFILFVIFGIYGIYSIDFISVNQTMKTAFEWCIIPTIIFSLYYAYHSSFGYKKTIAIWRNTFTFIAIAIMVEMISFTSSQGILMLINKNIGRQKEYLLSGKITKLNYPENKKIGNKYSIEIERKLEKDTIELNVPTNQYFEKQKFKKRMKIGSLNFIYAEE
jgi:hypothetical protein